MSLKSLTQIIPPHKLRRESLQRWRRVWRLWRVGFLGHKSTIFAKIGCVQHWQAPRLCSPPWAGVSLNTTSRYVTYLPAVSLGRTIFTTCPRESP